MTNPLLQRLLPGTTFTLPSLGAFYKNGELSDDVIDGAVRVHPLSTHDELVLRSPDMVFTGDAIDVVFSRCIPQVKKPTQLLAKDVDFLLAALRVVTYGNDLEVTYDHRCHENLEEKRVHKYHLNVMDVITNTIRLDVVNIESDFSTRLDNGQVVKFRPMTFIESLESDKAVMDIPDEISFDELAAHLAKSVALLITHVDEVTDPELITDWLLKIPAGYTNQITDAIAAANNWGPNFSQALTCAECGEEVHVDLWTSPASFFI